MTAEIHQPSFDHPDSEIYRILVMDSSKHIALLKEAAQTAGHEVVAVTSIAQAMNFLNSRDHVDVVISAVHLEQESVFDFLKQMKGSKLHKDVPFMMLCTDASEFALAVDDSVRTAASVMGADKYLTMTTYDVKRLMKEITAILPERFPHREMSPEGAY